jgi:hypothetical protein
MRILLSVLALLTLASCQSFGKERIVLAVPSVDCAATDGPRAPLPTIPTVESIPAWQLYGFGWQAVAEDVLNQRVETARCLQVLKAQGVIK